MEACVSVCPSSIFLIASAIVSAKHFATQFTSDVNSSQVSSSSDLLVRQQRTECDHKQSPLSFCLERRDVLSHSLGGSCPDPPCTVLSGTALPLPLSGSMTLYSISTSLVLGDSCAPVFDPPPTGGRSKAGAQESPSMSDVEIEYNVILPDKGKGKAGPDNTAQGGSGHDPPREWERMSHRSR